MIVAGQEEKKKEEAQEQSSPPLRARKELQQATCGRMAKDTIFYPKEERIEIENPYQSCPPREGKRNRPSPLPCWRFPKANRTGCAMFYLAQDWARQKRTRLLKQAIQNHGGCRYDNGLQVGAMARYRLINALMETGKQEEAKNTGKSCKPRSRMRSTIPGRG